MEAIDTLAVYPSKQNSPSPSLASQGPSADESEASTPSKLISPGEPLPENPNGRMSRRARTLPKRMKRKRCSRAKKFPM